MATAKVGSALSGLGLSGAALSALGLTGSALSGLGLSVVSPGGSPDKHGAVRSMFDSIAPGYDTVNRLMTLGLDLRWRREAARVAALDPGGRALDIGTGTGDLAIALARSAADTHVVGLDYAAQMLVRAPAKAAAAGLGDRIAWVSGDGHTLPFADATFDAVASAFVLRNFASLDLALAEMSRVLVPGGRLVALEATPTGSPFMRAAASLHSRFVVPVVGALLTGNPGAYRYLGDSIAAFVTPAEMAGHLSRAGLHPGRARPLAGGVVVIHRAWKPTT